MIARVLSWVFSPPTVLVTGAGEIVESQGRAKRILRWLAGEWRPIERAIAKQVTEADAEGDRLSKLLVPSAWHDAPMRISLATILAHEIRRGIAAGRNPFVEPGYMLEHMLAGKKGL